MDNTFNSHGCIPGVKCRCPRVYQTCTAWTVLFEGKVTEGFYHRIAFQSHDELLDMLGWDIVEESLSECVTLDDFRAAWTGYRDKMNDSLRKHDPTKARFFAWAMVTCERRVSQVGL
jgi:hypothetical protein